VRVLRGGAPQLKSGLILAGGASSRFRGRKGLAALRGRPLVRWVGDALQPFCGELLLSIGVKDEARRFRETLPEAVVVRDQRGDRGPIEGLHRGCAAAHGNIVLVAPSDAPLLRPALYESLLSILGDHDVAVPRIDTLDPVRAVYRREAVLRMVEEQGNRIRSPSALVDRLDTTFLEGDALLRADPTLASFIDVNRRSDLDMALRAAEALG
jgi:molybdenum cofactor guanylyltransferase